ncbi:MAG: hypothetical protein IJM79_05260 [Erysipelotrichaceae bacterium]|nr:hypothetical protein [Erysipelotrichaceae bacterium]
MKCPFCGSEDIIKGVVWSGGMNCKTVGLSEKNLLGRQTHQVCSDVCRECGTIVRTYLRGYDYLKTQNISWETEKEQNAD